MAHKTDVVIDEDFRVTISDLEVGDLAIVVEEGSSIEGHYVVKAYSETVSLNDFEQTYPNNSHIEVCKITNATVTLTFGKGA